MRALAATFALVALLALGPAQAGTWCTTATCNTCLTRCARSEGYYKKLVSRPRVIGHGPISGIAQEKINVAFCPCRHASSRVSDATRADAQVSHLARPGSGRALGRPGRARHSPRHRHCGMASPCI